MSGACDLDTEGASGGGVGPKAEEGPHVDMDVVGDAKLASQK